MRKPTITALAAGLTMLMLAGSVQAQDMLELKLATAEVDINPTANSILKLADRLGFYEKHGVKVTVIELDGTPQAVAALTSGAADVADVSIDAAIRLRADNGIMLKGLTSGGMGAAFLIAGKSDIKSVADLVGRSFGIADNGSLDHNLSQIVLKAEGVPADGPNYVAIGAPAVRAQALAAGQIDATTVSQGTFLSIADAPNVHIIMPADEFAEKSPGMTKFIAALDTTIETKREALTRFVAALVDMSRTYDANPELWVDAVAAARDDLKKEDLTKTAALINGRWCVNGCMNQHEIDKAVDFVYANPDFKDVAKVTAAEMVDQTIVAAALEMVGGIDTDPGLDKR